MSGIHSILVPVDFSINTSIALSKAIDLLEGCQPSATIHLYHVQKIHAGGPAHMLSGFFAGYSRQQMNSDIGIAKASLEELKKAIEKKHEGLKVVCWVSSGQPVQESIIKKARQLAVDLIIIGKHKHHSLFPFLNTIASGKLAFYSGISVLTVKPGSIRQQVKTVVIPVVDSFPETKLTALDFLYGHSSLNIRLVMFQKKDGAPSMSRQLLFDSFRALKNNWHNKVNYETITGKNKAKALLSYCRKVDADVLIVYPGVETRTGRWFNGQLSDLLPAESRTQVLAVIP